jgi:hypothetical protein
MGWAIVEWVVQKRISNCRLEVHSKLEFFKNKHFTSYNVSKMNLKISKEKQISLFLKMSFEIFASFQKEK